MPEPTKKPPLHSVPVKFGAIDSLLFSLPLLICGTMDTALYQLQQAEAYGMINHITRRCTLGNCDRIFVLINI